MSTKAYYPINEIGAGKTGFSKTRSIIEAAFYGNNVVKVNTLKEAYELAKNSPGTVVTDMPVYRGEEFGLERDAKVLLFNDGAITGRYAAARRIAGEPGVAYQQVGVGHEVGCQMTGYELTVDLFGFQNHGAVPASVVW